eukprot:6274613-Prymnesium_polylepis.1
MVLRGGFARGRFAVFAGTNTKYKTCPHAGWGGKRVNRDDFQSATLRVCEPASEASRTGKVVPPHTHAHDRT